MTKKKVLIFLQSEVGGAERVSATIGKNLDKKFFDVIFYAVGPWECKIKAFIPTGMFKEHLKYSNPLKLIINLYRVIQRETPSIIFSSTMYINTKLLLLQPFFKDIKFVVRSENNFFTFNKRQQWMIRHLYRRAQKVIAQTDEMCKELVEKVYLSKEKVVVIQNPQDFKSIDMLAEESNPYNDSSKKYFVASGRFVPEKGFDILIQAFAKVAKHLENAELYIIGKNSGLNEQYYKQIQNIINTFGLKEKIHCIGYRKNPYVYVKNADSFVLSSRNEGLPNVLIEALYLGTPVAATTCIPAISRIVENSKTGFLAEPGNPEELANAMLNAVKLGRIQSNYPKDTSCEFNDLFKSFLEFSL